MRIDQLVMFTSEVACVELNTLRDEMTVIIPDDFDIMSVHPSGVDGPTHIRLTRRAVT
jgi:hypothetical protein